MVAWYPSHSPVAFIPPFFKNIPILKLLVERVEKCSVDLPGVGNGIIMEIDAFDDGACW